MKRARTIGALACAAALIAAAPAAAEVVTPADVDSGGEWYSADTRPPGTGTFEFGPPTPPAGQGSFEMRTPAGSNPAKVQLLTTAYDGTPLGAIDGLSYASYRDPSSTGFIAGMPALNIRADLDGNGTSDAYLVYEPYQDQGNAAVQTGVWQTWDAYAGGSAKWWINTGAGGCGQATPCAWSTIVASFPNATVREAPNCGPGGIKVPCPGSLGVNLGSFNEGLTTNADNLTVSVSGAATTYDFEPTIAPASKDDCKNGGWQTFNSPVFKNQGDCVSYFAPGQVKKRS